MPTLALNNIICQECNLHPSLYQIKCWECFTILNVCITCNRRHVGYTHCDVCKRNKLIDEWIQ